MRAALSLILAVAIALPGLALAQDVPPTLTEEAEDAPPTLMIIDAAETTLDEHLWASRPLVVFADTPRDPRFQEQLDLLLARPGPLIERDVVVIFDSNPDGNSAIRQHLRPRGFSLVLLQRDGQVAFRKPNPWDVREITRAIDNLPMRIEEIGQSQ
ncbi:DUF4174 domain-containing protein [Nioella nitratireducens]|uniref:DUF4174 domain-containing protein n=1 Tax=Nioella nitratireducens TaxID=1287720 RepID=UPI0008FD73A6|nr:DUF4174 domain-containing protein [Nioella nitratireducens]